MVKRLAIVATVATVATVASLAAAGNDSRRVAPVGSSGSKGTLTFAHATLTGRVGEVTCPQVDPSKICFDTKTSGVVRGLGVVSESNLNIVEDPDSPCEIWHSNPVLTVAGKGEIQLEVNPSRQCVAPTTGVLVSTLRFAVTGGTGIYAGASGGGTFATNATPGTGNRETDTLDGTLTVAGLKFDATPPTIRGARAKTVFARHGAKSTRVQFTVSARDAGRRIPVRCKPRSGATFKLGRTRVLCRAMDASGNTATARFVITVRPR